MNFRGIFLVHEFKNRETCKEQNRKNMQKRQNKIKILTFTIIFDKLKVETEFC